MSEVYLEQTIDDAEADERTPVLVAKARAELARLRADKTLADALCARLSPFAGETGANEGAEDVLVRVIDDRASAREHNLHLVDQIRDTTREVERLRAQVAAGEKLAEAVRLAAPDESSTSGHALAAWDAAKEGA